MDHGERCVRVSRASRVAVRRPTPEANADSSASAIVTASAAVE
jgi:hypothetical protein